ncbi:MAG: hypothetical protein ACK4ZJ_18195, partial [Allorhizobium sp.]
MAHDAGPQLVHYTACAMPRARHDWGSCRPSSLTLLTSLRASAYCCYCCCCCCCCCCCWFRRSCRRCCSQLRSQQAMVCQRQQRPVHQVLPIRAAAACASFDGAAHRRRSLALQELQQRRQRGWHTNAHAQRAFKVLATERNVDDKRAVAGAGVAAQAVSVASGLTAVNAVV